MPELFLTAIKGPSVDGIPQHAYVTEEEFREIIAVIERSD
jgi:hypothetical protein